MNIVLRIYPESKRYNAEIQFGMTFFKFWIFKFTDDASDMLKKKIRSLPVFIILLDNVKHVKL